MFKNPYDTTPCVGYNYQKLVESLETLLANAAFRNSIGNVNIAKVLDLSEKDNYDNTTMVINPGIPVSMLPLFSHPISLENDNTWSMYEKKTGNNINRFKSTNYK